jgi:hypothetical protein
MTNTKKDLKIGQLTTFALKVLDRWFFGEMKAEDELYKMRWSNQKIAH